MVSRAVDTIDPRSTPSVSLLVGLPPTIAVHWLWGSPWWLAAVPKLMGAEP